MNSQNKSEALEAVGSVVESTKPKADLAVSALSLGFVEMIMIH